MEGLNSLLQASTCRALSLPHVHHPPLVIQVSLTQCAATHSHRGSAEDSKQVWHEAVSTPTPGITTTIDDIVVYHLRYYNHIATLFLPSRTLHCRSYTLATSPSGCQRL